MFKNIFSKSPIMPVPDQIRENVEEELGNFVYSVHLAWSCLTILTNQNNSSAQKLYELMESNVKASIKAIENIKKLWPKGESAINNLVDITNFLPDWFINVRSWDRYIREFQRKESAGIDKETYQNYVRTNRKYTDLLEENMTQATKKLLKAEIHFKSIIEKSDRRLASDFETGNNLPEL